ncbi:hypothetical protein SOVF_057360 [Spinacia oleracea]|nr:hypothetical protein SOVF_057360 [Spinacia oleracea]
MVVKPSSRVIYRLFSCVDILLSFLKVKTLVLPAAEEAGTIWTDRFGFTKMTVDQVHPEAAPYRNLSICNKLKGQKLKSWKKKTAKGVVKMKAKAHEAVKDYFEVPEGSTLAHPSESQGSLEVYEADDYFGVNVTPLEISFL